MKNNLPEKNSNGALTTRPATPDEPSLQDWAPEAEPWPEPVDGRLLLDEIRRTLARFVVLPNAAGEALALWCLHSYAFHLREVTTYLGIESPEMRCGKTTLLTVLGELVNRPVIAANISPPAFFRVIEEARPTLLIDEADTLLLGNDELRGILNSGYTRKTAFVVRVANETRNEDPKPKPDADPGEPEDQASNTKRLTPVNEPDRPSRLARFSCWCPKAMAAIGRLPQTLADRCIVIRMQRKTWREECARLRELNVGPLRRQCARFVLDHADAIARARPALPPSLHDRAADIWEPLLALADLAGGIWPALAREAAVNLTAKAQETNPIASLLLDILLVFVQQKVSSQAASAAPPAPAPNPGSGAPATPPNNRVETHQLWDGRLFSRTLVDALNLRADRPWAALKRGRSITELWLAQQLRPYGVRPRTLRIGEFRAKGYFEADFKDVFQRYIPPIDFDTLLAEEYGPAPDQPATCNL